MTESSTGTRGAWAEPAARAPRKSVRGAAGPVPPAVHHCAMKAITWLSTGQLALGADRLWRPVVNIGRLSYTSISKERSSPCQ